MEAPFLQETQYRGWGTEALGLPLSLPSASSTALTSWEVALWVIEAVWVGGPLEGMPWREVVLHEARRKAVEAVGVRRLAELRVLLVRWEGASEGRWPLHAEGRLTLPGAPGWLLMLAIPGALELAVPVGVWLVVPGCVTLAIPAGVTALLGPHALVAVVPGWAVGWAALVVWVRWLLGRLQGMAGEGSAGMEGPRHPCPLNPDSSSCQ